MRWFAIANRVLERVALTLGAVALVASGCSERGGEAPGASAAQTGSAAGSAGVPAPLARVRVASVELASGGEASFASYIQAEREAELVAETDGTVTGIRVREGQRVSVGQTLLIIDDRDERLAVKRDEAELAWSRSRYERMQRLQTLKHVSDQEVEQARIELQRAEAELGLSRMALSRCVVRAPIAGLVWMIRAEPLHRVTIGQPLLRVTDPNRLRVAAYLPGALRGQVRAGMPVRIEPTRGGPALWATIQRVDPLTDPASGTFRVVAGFRRLPTHPESGTEVRLVIPSGEARPGLLLPMAAIVESDGDSTWVWRCDGDRVRRCAVRLGPVRRDGIRVEAGIGSGTRVVIGSDRPLQDGAMVEVVSR